ncbi:MAG TPA: tyrosine-type recombinase/integrase [Phototrophicaceae bacterium]|nr:tyrosine-type recombinase/integrase [Phototrophicaceae bacterium]
MSSLQEVINIYIRLDRSPITNLAYAGFLNRMAAAVGPARDIRRITFGDLVDYMAEIRNHVSASTHRQYNQIVRGFFAWCAEARYIKESPAAGLLARTPPKEPRNRAIPLADLRALLDALRDDERDFAFVMFMADTGCRVGGLVSLRLANLDLAGMTAVLHEKGDRYYTVYFGEATADALRRWLAKRPVTDHDYVFTAQVKNGVIKPLSQGGVSAIMARTSARVCSQVWRPHSIRHAVGHRWAEEGIPISLSQSKLGHTSANTTLSFYYPNSPDQLQQLSHQYSLASLLTGSAGNTDRSQQQPQEQQPQGRADPESDPSADESTTPKIIRLKFR